MSASDIAETRKRSRQNLLEGYRTWLIVERGNKENTTKDMMRWTQHFFNWLDREKKTIEDVDQDTVNAYILACKEHYSPNTLVPLTANLRKLLDHYLGRDLKIRMCRPQAPKRDKTPYSRQEVQKMFDVAEGIPLDYAVLKTLYFAGPRNKELRSLDIPDVNFDTYKITIRKGKRDRGRTVNITKECAEVIQRYLEQRPIAKAGHEEALFISCYRTRISSSYLRDMVKRVASQAGVTRQAYPHKFRITMITHMAEKGCSIREIMAQSGHKDEKTLLKYIQHSSERIRETYDRVFGQQNQSQQKEHVKDRRPERPQHQQPKPDDEHYQQQIMQKYLDGELTKDEMSWMLDQFGEKPSRRPQHDRAYC